MESKKRSFYFIIYSVLIFIKQLYSVLEIVPELVIRVRTVRAHLPSSQKTAKKVSDTDETRTRDPDGNRFLVYRLQWVKW